MNFRHFRTLCESAADEWLERYTYQGLDKWPGPDTVKELLQDYPYEGGTIYRGMNFRTQEEYEKFTGKLSSGKLKTGGITSWTVNEQEAENYAVTRPTYYLNRDLMHDEDEKRRSADWMIGYRGTVLQMTIPNGVAIDVRKSEHAHESEIILPPGEYPVKVLKTLTPFRHQYNSDNAEQELLKLTKDDVKHYDSYNFKKLRFLLYHFKELSEKSRRHLFTLFSDKLNRADAHVESHQTDSKYWETVGHIDVAVTIPGELITYYAVLLPEDQAKIKRTANRLVKKVTEKLALAIDDLGGDPSQIEVNKMWGFDALLDLASTKVKEQYKRLIGGKIGQSYQDLNDTEVKKINSIKDERERREAVDSYIKRLQRLLKNI